MSQIKQHVTEGKWLPELFVDRSRLQVLELRHGQEHGGGADRAAKRAGGAWSIGTLCLISNGKTGES